MAVRGTANYVYFTDNSLGVGATGNVFFGRHKRRGDPCAIKVFRSTDGGNKETLLRQREFDVMSKLDHENIVKFIVIEQESRGNDRVLIMELCMGGSVYKMLEEPENSFGFIEDEFLIFLRDITKALQYLRQNGIVHRDIKPGNILRYIKDDLSSVYKLTDFGAARELPEDGEFMSLYGTEEYLHPDLYARALLGANRFDRYPKSFSASVDLWSLGVTLYHVATGRLPFQPFGGRKNKEAMHMIISKKESGFISGIQHTKDSSIEWSRDLPKTCRLSWGLKQLFIPMLVGLLESERRHQWNFETFFHASNDITSRTIVHLFCVSSCSNNRICLSQEERKSLTHLQEHLAEVTKIPASRQLLYHVRWSEEELISQMKSNIIQKTTLEFPLYVLTKSYVLADWSMTPLDIPRIPLTSDTGDISEDATYARSACAFAMYLHDLTKRLLLSQDFMINSVNHLGNLLTTSLQEAQFLLQSSTTSCNRLKKLKMKLNSSEITACSENESLLNQLISRRESLEAEYVKLNEAIINQCSSSLKTLFTKICHQTSCIKKQEHIVKELENIRTLFREHKRKEKDLSYNEKQIHKFDKTRAAEGVKKSMDLYGCHCSLNTEAAWKQLQDFHRVFSKRKSEIEDMENSFRNLHIQFLNTEERMFDMLVLGNRDRDRRQREIDKNGEFGCLYISSKPDPLSSFYSGNDSAFITGSGRSSVTSGEPDTIKPDKKSQAASGWCIQKSTHAPFVICEESIPEDISEDSGIEMLAGLLKETLRSNSDCLKQTISKSSEMDSLINSTFQ